MISHCANPACALPFHYLRGGRLYRFDIRSPQVPCADVPNSICTEKPPHAIVFFWLCEHCSSQYSLSFDCREGVKLVSLPRRATRATTAPVIAVTPVGAGLR